MVPLRTLKKVICLISFSISFTNLQAQIKLSFNIIQTPALETYAGEEVTIESGGQVQIGGETPAKGGKPEYSYYWEPSSGLDQVNIPNPVASPDTTTTYTLTVTDANGCTSTSSVIVRVNNPLDISDDLLQLVKIYPNPNQGKLIIEMDAFVVNSFMKIEIISPLGHLIFQEDISRSKTLLREVDISKSGSGFFLVRLLGKSQSITQKIVLE